MARSTKDDWLAPSAGDLEVVEISDVPVKGKSVKIRALSATAANAATSSAVSTEEHRGQTRMKVDSVKLDILRFAHGCIEPTFTLEEATIVSGKFGPAFNKVLSELNRISGITEEQVRETEARFQGIGGDTAPGNGTSPAADADGPDKSRGTGNVPEHVRK